MNWSNVVAVLPAFGLYAFLFVAVCAVVALWIKWEDRPSDEEEIDWEPFHRDPWAWANEAVAAGNDEDYDGAPCCPDPGCPGGRGYQCTFPGYADNH